MTERLEELRESFNECDANKDGHIQLNEFASLLKNLNSQMNEDETQLGFQELDTDKDGVISFEEFSAWWTDN